MTKLVAAVQQALCPPGTIVAYGGDTAPPGWLMCDGAHINRTTFAALFSVIGTRFGTETATEFRVPDFRGKFLRGRAAGLAWDPDRNSRSAFYFGGAFGDNVGSFQADAFRAHSHTWQGSNGNNSPANTDFSADEFGSKNRTESTSTVGGSETRPVNIYVNYIIKF
jgi:microcystin-dependent protein